MVNIVEVKRLGKEKSSENLEKLLVLYENISDIDLKREVVSSIGRQKDLFKVLSFIKQNIYKCHCMDLVYQMYRTILYNQENPDFMVLKKEVEDYFDNEIINKMNRFYQYRQRD